MAEQSERLEEDICLYILPSEAAPKNIGAMFDGNARMLACRPRIWVICEVMLTVFSKWCSFRFLPSIGSRVKLLCAVAHVVFARSIFLLLQYVRNH